MSNDEERDSRDVGGDPGAGSPGDALRDPVLGEDPGGRASDEGHDVPTSDDPEVEDPELGEEWYYDRIVSLNDRLNELAGALDRLAGAIGDIVQENMEWRGAAEEAINRLDVASRVGSLPVVPPLTPAPPGLPPLPWKQARPKRRGPK